MVNLSRGGEGVLAFSSIVLCGGRVVIDCSDFLGNAFLSLASVIEICLVLGADYGQCYREKRQIVIHFFNRSKLLRICIYSHLINVCI